MCFWPLSLQGSCLITFPKGLLAPQRRSKVIFLFSLLLSGLIRSALFLTPKLYSPKGLKNQNHSSCCCLICCANQPSVQHAAWFTQQRYSWVWRQKIVTDFIKENSCYFGGDGSRAPTGDYPQSLHSIMDPGFYFYSLSLGLSLSLSLFCLSPGQRLSSQQ